MEDQSTSEYSHGSGCLTRIYWMFLGNALLFFALAVLFQKLPKFPSLLDAACLFAAASLVCVRYIDIRYCKGETGDGRPATMADWRIYSLFVSAGSAAAWLAIRFLVPLVMS